MGEIELVARYVNADRCCGVAVSDGGHALFAAVADGYICVWNTIQVMTVSGIAWFVLVLLRCQWYRTRF